MRDVVHIHDLNALEQAAAVRRREISPVEITEHYLDRIARLDSQVGAYVTVTPELALEQAQKAEARVLAGGDPSPLLGVPIPIKDLNLVKGVPVHFGSAAYEDFVAPVDDSVVERLRDAGTIMLGKTATPEFGMPCYTETSISPPTRTPWDLSRSAGGSSGGAAAAVAAGLAPAAQGSDGAGRSGSRPRSAGCTASSRPGAGSAHAPIVPDLAGLATNGPIARTVADAAALLDVMTARQPRRSLLRAAAGARLLLGLRAAATRVVCGSPATPSHSVPGAVVEPEVLAAYERASAELAGLGHEVVDIDPPFTADLVPQFVTLWCAFACMHPVDLTKQDRLRPLTAWLRGRGFAIPAPDFLQAQSALQLATRSGLLVTNQYDAVLTPTLTQPPQPVGWFEEVEDPEETLERMKRFAAFPAIYNVSGQPAVNLPLYWTAEGLPIGVMLAGRFGDEGTLISVSAQVEAARGGFWGERRPAVW